MRNLLLILFMALICSSQAFADEMTEAPEATQVQGFVIDGSEAAPEMMTVRGVQIRGTEVEAHTVEAQTVKGTRVSGVRVNSDSFEND